MEHGVYVVTAVTLLWTFRACLSIGWRDNSWINRTGTIAGVSASYYAIQNLYNYYQFGYMILY